jgi:hypothetical protein
MVLAVAGAVVAAGVAGWLLAGAFGAASPQRPAGTPHAAAAARTVEVNAGALTGEPAGQVSQRLRQLGLHPRVLWATNGDQPPGTVISVQPSGPVTAGATVTVTAALAPPGHRDGQGHDHGQGGDQGGGQGGG